METNEKLALRDGMIGMTSREKKQIPVCPSCGQPIRSGFFRFEVSDKVKVVLALLMIGYFALSLLIMVAISPATGRGRGCRRYDYTHQPDWCKETEFKLSVRLLNDVPALQVFVGGGLAMGLLVFYWDWLENMYENWQQKREKLVQERGKIYKYMCRHCGRQWN